jgi:hypothetical protein
VVGAGGAGINKLREALGVNVDFSDEPEGGADGTGKAKKKKSPQAKVKASTQPLLNNSRATLKP